MVFVCNRDFFCFLCGDIWCRIKTVRQMVYYCHYLSVQIFWSLDEMCDSWHYLEEEWSDGACLFFLFHRIMTTCFLYLVEGATDSVLFDTRNYNFYVSHSLPFLVRQIYLTSTFTCKGTLFCECKNFWTISENMCLLLENRTLYKKWFPVRQKPGYWKTATTF